MNKYCRGASAVEVEVGCIKTSLKRKSEETIEVPSTIKNGCTENSSNCTRITC